MPLARTLLLTFALLPVLCSGCGEPKPVAGKFCKGDSPPTCDGSDRMLTCVDTQWLALPCRGARGCFGSPAQCDASLARPGDACIAPAHGETETCSQDRSEVLVCEERAFAPARPCRGPKKCESEWPGKMSCDETVGAVGEPCSKVESRMMACSTDSKAVLECESVPTGKRVRGRTDGILTLQHECPTVAGCKQSASWAYCDFTGATVDSPCGKGNENRTFCSPDRKAVLKCDPSTLKLRKELDCPKGTCKVDDADGRTHGGC